MKRRMGCLLKVAGAGAVLIALLAYLYLPLAFWGNAHHGMTGMFVGIAGTLLILFFYKLLGGYYFVEGEYVTRSHRRRRSYGRRRRYSSAVYED